MVGFASLDAASNKRFTALLCSAALLPGVMSHAYMAKPKSRAELHCTAAGHAGDFYCINHRSSATSDIKWPQLPGHVPGKGTIPEPVCSPPGSPIDESIRPKLDQPGPIQATYQAGAWIDVEFKVEANHDGAYAYRLCTDGRDSSSEECFKKGYLKFEDGSVWKQNPVSNGNPHYRDRVKLPDGVGCERCTLSLRWDAGKDENQVWTYCADIKIEGGGRVTPTPPAPPATPTPPATASCTGGVAAGSNCKDSKCCADASLTCYEKDDYFATCRPDCTPGSINPGDPVEFQTPWSCTVLGKKASEDTTTAPAGNENGNLGADTTTAAAGSGNGNLGANPGADTTTAAAGSENGALAANLAALLSSANGMVALPGHLLAAITALSISVACS